MIAKLDIESKRAKSSNFIRGIYQVAHKMNSEMSLLFDFKAKNDRFDKLLINSRFEQKCVPEESSRSFIRISARNHHSLSWSNGFENPVIWNPTIQPGQRNSIDGNKNIEVALL